MGVVEDDRDELALDDTELLRGTWELWKMTEMKQL